MQYFLSQEDDRPECRTMRDEMICSYLPDLVTMYMSIALNKSAYALRKLFYLTEVSDSTESLLRQN